MGRTSPRSSLWRCSLIVLAACGGAADAPDAGPSVDASPPIDSGPPGPITVTALSRCCDGLPGVPVAGVSVIVDDDVVTTDANGMATIVVEPGASVTAVYPQVGTERPDVVTWIGVEPGDSLVFGESFTNLPAPTESATVTWSPPPGVSSYELHDGCTESNLNGSTTQATIEKYGTTCADPTTDVLLVATVNSTTRRWSMLRDVTIVEGAVLPMPPFADATTFTAGVTGLPASLTAVSVYATPQVGGRDLPWIVDDGRPSNGSYQVTGPWTAATRIRVSVFATRPDHFGMQVVTRVLDGTATSGIIEEPELLPWVTAIGTDPWRRELVFETEGSGTYGVTLLDLAWGDAPEHHWQMFAPPGRELTWPRLPPEFADLEPSTSDAIYPSITLVDIDGASYDAIRALPEAEVLGQLVSASRNESHDFR